MNQRIKDIAVKAGWAGFDTLDERIEHFAELIIQECAEVQMKRSCDRHGYDKYEDSQAIKHHFEVKE